jgi:hypothetical protein
VDHLGLLDDLAGFEYIGTVLPEDGSGITRAKRTYTAFMFKKINEGITYADATNDHPMRIFPQFPVNEVKREGSSVVYVVSSEEQHVYTFQTNGIRNDIKLKTKPIQNNVDYVYTIKIPSGASLNQEETIPSRQVWRCVMIRGIIILWSQTRIIATGCQHSVALLLGGLVL